jgi:hypothetical protein
VAVFPVVIDSCVLYNAAVRDTMLRAAAAGLYRPHWSQQILDDAIRNMLKDGRLKTDSAAQRLRFNLMTHFPEASVEVPTAQVEAMQNNCSDRHVAAAGVVAHAQVIVTFNLKHFPVETLAPYQLEAQSPDEFLRHLLDLDYVRMHQIITEQAATLRSPAMTVRELLKRLEQDAPQFVSAAALLFHF